MKPNKINFSSSISGDICNRSSMMMDYDDEEIESFVAELEEAFESVE